MDFSPVTIFLIALGTQLFRYILFAGGAWLVFYVWKRRAWLRFRIQTAFPQTSHIRHEIKHSLITFLVFSIIAIGTHGLRKLGYTQVYSDVSAYGIPYLILSVFLQIFFHDTWFYWTHRLMHHKKLYRFMHLTHHHSTNPTPWAAFSFHWSEAIVEAMVLPVMLFLFPLHHWAILAFLLYMTLLNVFGHLGFEILPKNFTRHFLFKWHNTSVHHNMHHRYVNCNYGLYFNLWDRWMGTNHPHYLEEYDAVKSRAKTTT